MGWYSLLLSDRAGANGKIISIEAQPRTFELLDWTLEIGGMKGLNVQTLNKAVSNHSGQTVTMTYIPSRPLNNHIDESASAGTGGDQAFAVTTITVDDLVAEYKLERVDFIKVDVEGAEDLVWAGMSNTIKSNPGITIFMEVNTSRMRFLGKDPKPFFTSIIASFPNVRFVSDDIENPITETFLSVDDLLKRDNGEDTFVALFNKL
jgi:FkbM family methyltransferase